MRLGTVDVLVRAKTDKFNRDIDKSGKKVKGFAASGKKHLAGLSKSFVSLAGVAGVGLGAKSFLDTGIAAEKMSRGLEAALGSVQKGAEAQRFLREESERLGLVFENQVSDFQKIAAAARGTALEGQAIRDVYISIVEASTALQMSADDTSGTLRALSQMISKGNVQAEELRGQLGERLPGAFQLAAKAMGVTTQELNKMLETGQVAATDMLPKLAKILREQFAGSIASASKTAQAEINRLSNACFEMKKTFAETGALSVFATVVRWTTEDVKFLGDQIKLISGYWIDFFTTTKTEEIKAQIKEIEAELKSFKGFGIGLEKHTERFATSKIKEMQDLKKELIELQKIAEKPVKIDKPSPGKPVKIDNSWIKNMQAQESFALKMAEAEQSRLNRRYELEQEINAKIHDELLTDTEFRLQELGKRFLAADSFVKNKAMLDAWYVKNYEEISGTQEQAYMDLYNNFGILTQESYDQIYESYVKDRDDFISLTGDKEIAHQVFTERLTALNEEYEGINGGKRLDAQKDFNAQYAAMGKSVFDVEREQLTQQAEVWRGYGFDKEKIAELTSDKLKKINEAETKQRINSIQSVAGSMADGFKMISEMGGKHSKEAFAAYKAFKITETLISTYSGAMKAYEALAGIPYVGPALGIAAAAAVTAFGMAQVSMISNAQPPSYDLGGISEAKGIYQTGDIAEAHIPIPSGGRIPVEMKSDNQISSKPMPMTVNIHEAPGTQTRVEQSEDGQSLEVIIEQVEQSMQNRMSRGTGMAPFMDGRYGRAY